jgi:hypothetical protein
MSYVPVGAAGCGLPESWKQKYQWKDGKCLNTETGKFYVGDQTKSNCQCLHGPAPATGWAGVWEFTKDKFLKGETGYQGQKQPGITTAGIIVPAVAVVGGVALLLILKKKK